MSSAGMHKINFTIHGKLSNAFSNDESFENVMNNRYNEAEVAADKKLPEADKKITKEYPCVISIIKEKSNKTFIMGSNSGGLSVADDFAGKDCTVKLQGTSTLGNKSKNLEIY